MRIEELSHLQGNLKLPEGRAHEVILPFLNRSSLKNREVKAMIASCNKEFDNFQNDKQEIFNKVSKEIKKRSESISNSPKLKSKFGEFETIYKVKSKNPSHYYYRDGKKYLLCDEDTISKGSYTSLGEIKLNQGEYLVAYSVDYTGDENYTIFIKDFISPTKNTFKLKGKYEPQIEFSHDDNYLYLLKSDENKRPYQVVSYEIKSGKYKIHYTENRENYTVSMLNSRDDKFLIISSTTSDISEIKLLSHENQEIVNFFIPEEFKEYSIDILDGKVYVLVHNQEGRYDLYIKTFANWEVIHKFGDNEIIEGITIYEKYLLIEGRKNGFANLAILELKSKKLRWLTSKPMESYSLFDYGSPSDEEFIISHDSWISPTSYFKLSINSNKTLKLKLLSKDIIKSYKKEKYKQELHTFTSSDGRKIPISLIKAKGSKSDYLWVEAYGAYGHPLDAELDPYQSILLDNNISIAVIHARGGGEFGRVWHKEGRLEEKENTFSDIIEGIEYLIEKKIASKKKIIIRGGSAGGMACATVVNRRRDLFMGAVLNVPFLDVMTTMLQPEHPLTINEYDEWGNPSNSTIEFDRIKSYSPIDNIKKGYYPPTFITAGLQDYRVGYWESLRYYKKMKKINPKSRIMLKFYNSGHEISQSGENELMESFDIYSFALSLVASDSKN